MPENFVNLFEPEMGPEHLSESSGHKGDHVRDKGLGGPDPPVLSPQAGGMRPAYDDDNDSSYKLLSSILLYFSCVI